MVTNIFDIALLMSQECGRGAKRHVGEVEVVSVPLLGQHRILKVIRGSGYPEVDVNH